MPEIINPALLTDKDAEKMIRFFEAQSLAGVHVWKKNTAYTFYDGTEFQFIHDVVERKRSKKDHQHEVRYEFISDKRIGKGHFGSIYEIAGSLALTDGQIHFKQAGAHKGKTRVVKIQYHDQTNTSPESSIKEYNLSKEAAHMAVKEPTIQGSTSYSVMRKLPGSELLKILIADLNYQKPLTVAQRIELTQALTIAIQAQCTGCGIIHQDIKPENILVDLQATPIAVNIIDYGLSSQVTEIDRRRCGSSMYAAPEVWSGSVHTPKVDVFSMGRVIAILWHNPVNNFGIDKRDNLLLSKRSPNLYGLFSGINDISEEDKAIIQTLLEGMLAPEVEVRFSIEDAINHTKQLGLNLRVDFSAVNGEVDINKHRETLLKVLNEKQGYAPEVIETKRQEIEQRFEQAETQRKQEECAKLKNIILDYEEHLAEKLVTAGLYIKSLQDGTIKPSSEHPPEEYSSLQKKLITRYEAIHGVHEKIKNNKLLSDEDKLGITAAVETCTQNRPEWSEMPFLQKLTDCLSLGIKPLLRALFSKDMEKARQEGIQQEVNKSHRP